MITPKKPEWEITMRHAGNVVLAVPLAVGAELIVWKLSFSRRVVSTLGLIILRRRGNRLRRCLLSDFGMVLAQGQLNEQRIPINRKELRRRTKQFYDNLPER